MRLRREEQNRTEQRKGALQELVQELRDEQQCVVAIAAREALDE